MSATASLRVILYFSQILGLLPGKLQKTSTGFRFDDSKSCYDYIKVMFVFIVILQGGFTAKMHLSKGFEYIPEISTKAVMIVASGATFLSAPTVLYMLFKKKKEFYFWLNKLDDLFSFFSKSHYKHVSRLSHFLLATVATFIIMSVTFQQLMDREKFVPDSTMRISPLFEIWMGTFFLLLTVVKIFTHFFVILVFLLRNLYKDISQEIIETERNRTPKHGLHHIKRLRLRDLIARDFIDFLHSFFIPVIFLQFLWGFSSILYNVAVSARVGLPPLIQLAWTLYIVLYIFSIVTVCHITEKEAEKTIQCLHQKHISCRDVELREEIEIFSLQVQHTKVEFYALGFSKVNFGLLYSFVGLLTSNVVILLQFQADHNNNDGQEVCYKRVETNCNVNHNTNTKSVI